MSLPEFEDLTAHIPPEDGKGPLGLSADQATAFLTVMDAIENRTETEIYFLSGEAGTGKSYLVNQIVKSLGAGRVVRMAPTGLAASHIGGSTVHRFFGMKPPFNQPSGQAIANNMNGVDLVIVDEVSMLSAGILDMLINQLNAYEAVILLVGDFLQLSPVPDDGRDRDYNAPAYNSAFWPCVQPLLLKQNFRQVGDTGFQSVLNDLRRGNLSHQVARLFSDRRVATIPDDVPCLMPRRVEVDEVNQRKLTALDMPISVSNAIVTECNLEGGQAAAIIEIDRTSRAGSALRYAVGARVCMINNADFWVNGSLGYIVAIGPRSLDVKLDSGGVFPVSLVEFEINDAKGKLQVKYRQFPFMLAWAMTIHKAQGCTLEKVGINLSGHFANGMTYVSVSRCKSIEGLHFIGNCNKIRYDYKALQIQEGL